MLISIHILNLLIALIDTEEGWSFPDMANVKSLPSIVPAAHMHFQYLIVYFDTNKSWNTQDGKTLKKTKKKHV